jgi:isoleucyl-tRNA synthetase
LLGNLSDFPGAGVADPGSAQFTLVDRWILDRLQQVIEDCRAAYAAYEFHKVYHTLNQFCAVDLSSLYVDITKDRMYCDAPASPRRRATQMAMHQIFDALCRLLAPILVFTAEEAWSHRRPEQNEARRNAVEESARNDSVHLQLFPEPQGNLRDSVVSAEMEELLKLRGIIGQAVEKARQEKLIGNALEAAVILRCDARFATSLPREELEEFFILSDLQIEPAKEPGASITRTPNKKCARCWRHRPAVGTIAAHPELCDRCAAVVEART